MNFCRAFLLFTVCASPCVAVAVTPMEKVISLIRDLKSQVEAEGSSEMTVYNEFACFCRESTMDKSKSITNGQDDIGLYSSDIESKTAEKASTETELQVRKATQNELASNLKESQVRCAKTKAEYEANDADLSKAIAGLNGAIGALSSAKPASLISIRSSVEQSLALAGVLDLIEAPKRAAVSAFLQQGAGVDPSDPEYKYHSQGILDTINKLLTEFAQTKNEADTEWAKAKTACEQEQASLAAEMESNQEGIKQAKAKISELKGGIASARKSLVSAESLLKDDQQFLTDLTLRCEKRATDWDHRSQMRAGELQALTEALTILEDKAQPMDAAANKRALLQVVPQKQAAFIQEDTVRRRVVLHDHEEFASRVRQDSVAALLRKEGLRLRSPVLASLAMHAAADPFAKVKQLIQDLVERLISEATAEATKKGFCDTELGKANKDRDFRLADMKKLNTELAGLEVTRDELDAEIESLTESLAKLNEDLVTADADRKAEKVLNMQTLKDARDGVEAVTEALNVLKAFYKQAAKASTFLQTSPVDEATDGAGFAGAYKGNQKQSTGIIGLLEVIKSDFDRTLRTTDASEKDSAASFVKFDRVARSDIGGKETKKQLDEEDLATTKNAIAQGLADLQTNTDLLDSALKTIEDLKPTCIDTTMTYDERVQKREEEMAALKKALCILDTEAVEADCAV